MSTHNKTPKVRKNLASDPIMNAYQEMAQDTGINKPDSKLPEKGMWSDLDHPELVDGLVKANDYATIQERKAQGYVFAEDLQNALTAKEDSEDRIGDSGIAYDAKSGEALRVMVCRRSERDARLEQTFRGIDQKFLDDGFEDIPQHGHTSTPPPGSRIEYDDELYLD